MTTRGKKRFLTRLLSALLIVGLFLGSAPTSAFAASNGQPDTKVVAELPEGAGETAAPTESADGTPEAAAAKEPAETTVGNTADDPEETTAGDPTETTAEETAKDPTETAAEDTAKVPAKTTAGDTAEDPAKTTAGDTAKDPTETTAEETAEDPAKTTAGDTAEDPAKTTAGDTAKDPAETTAEETAEDPTKTTAEETADEDAMGENGAAPEETDAEPQTDAEVPGAVQAFLDAAAQIPSEITPDNAESVGEFLYGTVSLLYEELLGTSYAEREDVEAAFAKMADAITAVDAVLNIESSFYNTGESRVDRSADSAFYPNTTHYNTCTGNWAETGYGQIELANVGDTVTDDIFCRYYRAHGGWAEPLDYVNLTVSNSNPDAVSVSVTQQNGHLKVTFTRRETAGAAKIVIGYTCNNMMADPGSWVQSSDWYNAVSGQFVYTVSGSESDDSSQATHTYSVKIDLDNQVGYVYRNGDWSGRPVKTSQLSNSGISFGTEYTRTISGYPFNAWSVSNVSVSSAFDQSIAAVTAESHNYGDNPDLLDKTAKGIRFTLEGLKPGKTQINCRVTVEIPYRVNWSTGDVYGRYDTYTEAINVWVVKTERSEITLTYHDGGYTATQTGAPGSEFEIGKALITKDGYIFTGWALNPDGSAIYTPGERQVFNEDTDLYAVWETSSIDNLTVAKTAEKSAVMVGETFRYCIHIANNSSTPVTVSVTDALDPMLDYGKVSESDGGQYDSASHTVTWPNVNVPANGSKELYVWVKANTAGIIQNTATVRLGNETKVSDPVGVTATDPAPTAPTPPTKEDVDEAVKGTGKSSVVVSCQPERHEPGYFQCTASGRIQIGAVEGDATDGYTCEVTFLAAPFLNAYNVLKNTTEPETKHTLVSGPDGQNKTVTFQWDSAGRKWVLAENQETPVTFMVTCPQPAPAPGPNLEITKTVDKTESKVGDTLTYTIMVKNTGNAAAADVRVSDPLNTEYLEFAGYRINGQSLVKSAPADSLYSIGTLAAGSSATLVITAKVVKAGEIPENTAYLNPTDPTDPEGGNDGSDSSDPVDAGSKFSIRVTKSRTSGAKVAHGDRVAYEVRITNTSTASLWDLVIDDTMDPGLSLADPENGVTASMDGRGVNLKYLKTETKDDGKTVCYWEMEGEFPVGSTVILTYSGQVSNEGNASITLNNVAHGKAYTSQSQPATPASYNRQRAAAASSGTRPTRPEGDGFVSGSSSATVTIRGSVEDSSDQNVTGGGEGGGDKPGSSVTVDPRTYSVTYEWDLPAAAGRQLPTEPNHLKDDTVSLDAENRPGTEITTGAGNDAKTYVFSGWSVKEPAGLTVGADGTFTMPSADVTLTGTWTQKAPTPETQQLPYTVEWYADDNAAPFYTEPRGPVAAGSMASVTDADKVVSGYTFVADHAGNVLETVVTADGQNTLKLYFTTNRSPVEPTEPTEPENPIEPTEPENPTEPTEPESPTPPPAIPADPAPDPAPATPEPPAAPEPPVTPDTPVTPVVVAVPPAPAPAPTAQEEIQEEEIPLVPEETEEETEPETEPETQPETQEELSEIEEEALPLAFEAGNGGRAWALVNFALMNLAVFESVMLLIGYFVQTRKASGKEDEATKRKIKKKGLIRLLSLPIAVISVIAFCLTEDISLPTAFVDRWTLLMALIAVIQTVAAALSRKKEDWEETRA